MCHVNLPPAATSPSSVSSALPAEASPTWGVTPSTEAVSLSRKDSASTILRDFSNPPGAKAAQPGDDPRRVSFADQRPSEVLSPTPSMEKRLSSLSVAIPSSQHRESLDTLPSPGLSHCTSAEELATSRVSIDCSSWPPQLPKLILNTTLSTANQMNLGTFGGGSGTGGAATSARNGTRVGSGHAYSEEYTPERHSAGPMDDDRVTSHVSHWLSQTGPDSSLHPTHADGDNEPRRGGTGPEVNAPHRNLGPDIQGLLEVVTAQVLLTACARAHVIALHLLLSSPTTTLFCAYILPG